MTDPPMPSPPFPSPDNAALRVVVGNAIASVRNGEATVEEAILHAAVHGWYEGHVQGEDECPGCTFRGKLPTRGNRADRRATMRSATGTGGAPPVFAPETAGSGERRSHGFATERGSRSEVIVGVTV